MHRDLNFSFPRSFRILGEEWDFPDWKPPGLSDRKSNIYVGGQREERERERWQDCQRGFPTKKEHTSPKFPRPRQRLVFTTCPSSSISALVTSSVSALLPPFRLLPPRRIQLCPGLSPFIATLSSAVQSSVATGPSPPAELIHWQALKLLRLHFHTFHLFFNYFLFLLK